MSLVYTKHPKEANVFRMFSEECARIEAQYKEDGFPADAKRDNEIINLFDRYTKKYGLDWF